jgi:DNA-binding Xre family transcriptional regulator
MYNGIICYGFGFVYPFVNKNIEVIKMIDYSPLHKVLKERGISFKELQRRTDISNEPRVKLRQNKGEPVRLDTIEKVCNALSIPIEKVVYIDYENGDN